MRVTDYLLGGLVKKGEGTNGSTKPWEPKTFQDAVLGSGNTRMKMPDNMWVSPAGSPNFRQPFPELQKPKWKQSPKSRIDTSIRNKETGFVPLNGTPMDFMPTEALPHPEGYSVPKYTGDTSVTRPVSSFPANLLPPWSATNIPEVTNPYGYRASVFTKNPRYNSDSEAEAYLGKQPENWKDANPATWFNFMTPKSIIESGISPEEFKKLTGGPSLGHFTFMSPAALPVDNGGVFMRGPYDDVTLPPEYYEGDDAEEYIFEDVDVYGHGRPEHRYGRYISLIDPSVYPTLAAHEAAHMIAGELTQNPKVKYTPTMLRQPYPYDTWNEDYATIEHPSVSFETTFGQQEGHYAPVMIQGKPYRSGSDSNAYLSGLYPVSKFEYRDSISPFYWGSSNSDPSNITLRQAKLTQSGSYNDANGDNRPSPFINFDGNAVFNSSHSVDELPPPMAKRIERYRRLPEMHIQAKENPERYAALQQQLRDELLPLTLKSYKSFENSVLEAVEHGYTDDRLLLADAPVWINPRFIDIYQEWIEKQRERAKLISEGKDVPEVPSPTEIVPDLNQSRLLDIPDGLVESQFIYDHSPFLTQPYDAMTMEEMEDELRYIQYIKNLNNHIKKLKLLDGNKRDAA